MSCSKAIHQRWFRGHKLFSCNWLASLSLLDGCLIEADQGRPKGESSRCRAHTMLRSLQGSSRCGKRARMFRLGVGQFWLALHRIATWRRSVEWAGAPRGGRAQTAPYRGRLTVAPRVCVR